MSQIPGAPFPGVFPENAALHRRELAPGVDAEIAYGERIMLSRVSIAPDGVIPAHSHPHEQVGHCLEGRFELAISGEQRIVCAGEMYIIPGGVEHSARGIGEHAITLDVFSPPREDYMP